MRPGVGLWSQIGLGFHRNRTLPHVILNDLDWFYSAYEEKYFKGQLLAEAELIYHYAKTIKIKDGMVDLEEYWEKPQELKQFCEPHTLR